MKMSKILMTVASVACLAFMGLTSCELGTGEPSALGKDDFFGTWVSTYTVDSNNAAKGPEGNDGTIMNCDNEVYVDSECTVVMWFNGLSENVTLKSSDFWQYKTRYLNGTLKARTFWVGEYNLSDNANYTNGTLTLEYIYGIRNVAEEDAITYSEIWSGKAEVPEGFESKREYFKSLTTTGWCYEDKQDLEKFDFKLGDAGLLSGYKFMTATAKDKCEWEVSSRSFERKSNASNLAGALEGLKAAAENKEDTPATTD